RQSGAVRYSQLRGKGRSNVPVSGSANARTAVFMARKRGADKMSHLAAIPSWPAARLEGTPREHFPGADLTFRLPPSACRGRRIHECRFRRHNQDLPFEGVTPQHETLLDRGSPREPTVWPGQ